MISTTDEYNAHVADSAEEATIRCFRSRMTFPAEESRITRQVSGDVHGLHQMVMRGMDGHLPSGEESPRQKMGALFVAQREVEDREGVPGRVTGLLVQSLVRPHWDGQMNEGVFASANVQEKEETYRRGDEVVVRSWLNPVKSTSAPRGASGELARGKKWTLTHPEEIGAWVERTFDRHGLAVDLSSIVLGSKLVLTSPSKSSPDQSRNFAVIVYPVALQGQVVDAEKFAHAVLYGVGRGKAYGAGMLHVTPATW